MFTVDKFKKDRTDKELKSYKFTIFPNLTPYITSFKKISANLASNAMASLHWLSSNALKLIKSEQQYQQEQAIDAYQKLPAQEIKIINGLVTISTLGTAAIVMYYQPSFTLAAFTILRVLPGDIIRYGYKQAFGTDKYTDYALQLQDVSQKGLSLYQGFLPITWVQTGLVQGIDFSIRAIADKSDVDNLYKNYQLKERLWLYSGAVTSFYYDSKILSRKVEYIEEKILTTQAGQITLIRHYQCQWDLQECSLVYQNYSVKVTPAHYSAKFALMPSQRVEALPMAKSVAQIATMPQHDRQIIVAEYYSKDAITTVANNLLALSTTLVENSLKCLMPPILQLASGAYALTISTNNTNQSQRAYSLSTKDYSLGAKVGRQGNSVPQLQNGGRIIARQVGAYSYSSSEDFGCVTVDQANNFAYVCRGQRLVILDINNPALPMLKGQLFLNGIARDIALSSDGLTAFASTYYGLEIIDISNKTHPVVKGGLGLSLASGIALSSDGLTAFVVSQEASLQIIDISNKTVPVVKGGLRLSDSVRGIALSSDGFMAFVTSADVINSVGYLQIIDISNKTRPRVKGGLMFSHGVCGIALSADGFTAFVAAYYAGLQIIDISNKMRPVLKGELKLSGSVYNIAFSYDVRFLFGATSDSFYSIEINYFPAMQFNQAAELAALRLSGAARSIALSSDGLTAVVEAESAGLQVIDVSNKTRPVLKGRLLLSSAALDIALSPDSLTAFVAAYKAGLQIIDISNKAQPVLKGRLGLSGDAFGIALSSDGLTVVITAGAILQIIDISNKTVPVVIGGLWLSVNGWSGITLSSDGLTAVIAAYDAGLKIIDISNKTSPVLKGGLKLSRAANDLALSSNGLLAFVAASYTGLQVIDISNKTRPVLKGELRLSGNAYSIVLSADGKTAFVGIDFIFRIINLNYLLVWQAALPAQKVGISIFEPIYVYTDTPSILLTPQAKPAQIRIIGSDGITRNTQYWVNLEKRTATSTFTLTGVPPRQATDTTIILDVTFDAEDGVSYNPLFWFNVVASLSLNKTKPLKIEALEGIVTITLTLTRTDINLIVDPKSIRIYSPDSGIFAAFAPAVALNDFLAKLRYTPGNSSINTTVAIALDDGGINYPVHDVVNLSYFKPNQKPNYSSPILAQATEKDRAFEFIIPEQAFTDADDSIIYSARQTNASALPEWLTFVPEQRRFYGTPKALGNYSILITATDGYESATGEFVIMVIHPANQALYLAQAINQQAAPIGERFRLQISRTTFIDPDNYPEPIRLNASDLPPWLSFDAANWTFTGTPRSTDTDAFSPRTHIIILSATDGEVLIGASFVLVVQGDSLIKQAITYCATALGAIGVLYTLWIFREQLVGSIALRYQRASIVAYNVFRWPDYHFFFDNGRPLLATRNHEGMLVWVDGITGKQYQVFSRDEGRHLDSLIRQVSRIRTLVIQPKGGFKAQILGLLSKLFNGSIARICICLKLGMDPMYFTADSGRIKGKLPNWLRYDADSNALIIEPIINDEDAIIDTLIRVQFIKNDGRILEEIDFKINEVKCITRDGVVTMHVVPQLPQGRTLQRMRRLPADLTTQLPREEMGFMQSLTSEQHSSSGDDEAGHAMVRMVATSSSPARSSRNLTRKAEDTNPPGSPGRLALQAARSVQNLHLPLYDRTRRRGVMTAGAASAAPPPASDVQAAAFSPRT